MDGEFYELMVALFGAKYVKKLLIDEGNDEDAVNELIDYIETGLLKARESTELETEGD